MVRVIIKDPTSNVGIVLKTKYYEDALKLISTLYDYCIGFRKFNVSIEDDAEEV